MFKRKLWGILTLIFLIASLSACHTVEPAQTVPPTDTADNILSTEPVLRTVENLVIPAVSKNYRWVDGVDNLNEVTIVLPHLDPGSKCAAAFNAAIDEFASEIISEVEASAEGGYSTHITSVGYDAYLSGDTLSILITTGTSTDYVEYDVYNFDIEADEAMTVADMCDAYLDLKYPVFLRYTQDRILREFESEYSDFIAHFPHDYEFIRNLYMESLSIIRAYRLYLNEDGTLMLSCDRPSLAGAAYYADLQDFSIDPALLPDEAESWQWLLDLYLRTDQDNVEYAMDILITAYEDNTDGFLDALKLRPRNEQEAIEAAVHAQYNSKG